MEKNLKVCVTGGAGYLGSFLVNKLLELGYTVHATLRDLGDATKVGLLKGLVDAADSTKLKLFEADIYNPIQFASAIEDCQLVVHLATPLQHYNNNNSQYKDTSEAAVEGVKCIMETCIRSKTVKKVIYTASVVASSPLTENNGLGDFVDETCWTPVNLSYQYSNESLSEYVKSKVLAEQQVLSYNGKGIQVVSLVCGLVGGGTIQSSMAESMGALISQGLNDSLRYNVLRFLEELLGKVPILHIEDVTRAHIFSFENSHVNGRFLCASDFLKSADIAYLIQKSCQQSISISQGLIEDTKRETIWGSRKLEEVGFEYKYHAEKIIEDSILCAKRLGFSV